MVIRAYHMVSPQAGDPRWRDVSAGARPLTSQVESTEALLFLPCFAPFQGPCAVLYRSALLCVPRTILATVRQNQSGILLGREQTREGRLDTARMHFAMYVKRLCCRARVLFCSVDLVSETPELQEATVIPSCNRPFLPV